MNPNPPPQESEESFELPCIELIMAMLGNAVEEIQQLCHPIPRLRQRTVYFGKRKNNFADLHWFLTSADGAELLTNSAGINGVLDRYRRLAMPMLRKAEELAKATSDEMVEKIVGNPTVALISAPSPKVQNTPKRKEIQVTDSDRENLYSSVDIIAPKQAELFPDFFTSTRVSL